MKLTPEATLAVETIREAGGRPLLVGGCVRDFLLGVESKDFDIEVHGVQPDVVQEALSKVGRVDAVGVAFGVLKFGQDVDVSFPRTDSKSGVGHTGFTVNVDPFMPIQEALKRRDFTINSLAYDPIKYEVLDYFKGIDDLKARRLKMTSAKTFADDPLRVLRGIQFASRFTFSIARETADVCRGLVDRFSELSIERVWMEWSKILTRGKSMAAVAVALDQTGWLVHFPEWTYWESEETDEVLRLADRMGVNDERRSVILVTSMFRERPKEAKSFLKRIDAPAWLTKRAMSLIETKVPPKKMNDAAVRIVARKIRPNQMTDWLIANGHTPGTPLWSAATRQGVMEVVRGPLLTGFDLIELGMEEGPRFGTILKSALTAQDSEGWVTREQALEWLEKRLAPLV